jgi:glucose-6-phosphate 1-dehydrogenase
MTIFNSNNVGFGLYEVICKKIHMSFLHDHSNRMVILKPFQRKFKK